MKKLSIFALSFLCTLASASTVLAWKMPRSGDAIAEEVLGCYHAGARLTQADVRRNVVDAHGTSGQIQYAEGEIYFKGGLTGRAYKMTFVIESKWLKHEDGSIDYWVRIPLRSTTAPFADPNCYLAGWQIWNH